MPKKVLNTNLVQKYLEHIKNEKKVSEQTIKTYENIGKNIPFNLLNSHFLQSLGNSSCSLEL